MSASLLDQLVAGAACLGVPLDDRTLGKLVKLLELLDKWNAVYNLTAIKTRQEWVTHHLLDSLSVTPHLVGQRMLDVGTGPGFPGLPLAIIQPARSWTLVDSNQKKTAFAVQAAAELELENVQVQQIRIEQHRPPQRYDFVVSRAFAELADFVRLAGHLVTDVGYLAAMKGKVLTSELGAIPPTFRCHDVIPLTVPGVDAERHLILMQPVRKQG